MIYSLKGTLIANESNYIVIECMGVGYKCLTSYNTQNHFFNKLNKEVFVYTYMNVRQDAVDLFGFESKNELECFKLLTSVSGVGPKAALSILSQFTSQKISLIISAGDSKSLTSVPGIGAKTAQRIVLELKDKLTNKFYKAVSEPSATAVPTDSKKITEAMGALGVLGYSAADVLPILSQMEENLSIEEMIQKALKTLGKK